MLSLLNLLVLQIMKDVVNRYKLLHGYQVHYVPGWDCHGMPIEHKVLAQLKDKNVSPTHIRKEGQM